MFVSMSNSVLGSIFIKGGAVTPTLSKKHKKKRQRNKLKNSSLRKKRLKKHTQNQKNNSFIFNYSKFNPESGKIMSNWYWTNYKKAMEWQNRHQVAHWKATALALFEENRYLLHIINNMQPDMVTGGSASQKKLSKEGNLKKNKFTINRVIFPVRSTQKDNLDIEDIGVVEEEDEDEDEDEEQQECNENKNDDDDDDDDDDDFEIEMSEEMMQFFEQSYKRKMDLEKRKEEEEEEELLRTTEEKVEQIKINKMKRTSEMSFLYGEGASMITGMETAVQLSFDKYCESKSPKYWPNIPFRL